MTKKIKTILIKLSGEALAGNSGNTFDTKVLDYLVETLKDLQKENIKIGIVIGGGNLFRGVFGHDLGFDDYNAHHMGMTATYINGIALENYLTKNSIKSKLMTAVNYDGVGEKSTKQKSLSYLKEGNILIFAGGTGNPYFTTDSAGVLRALEIDADMVIKATGVDGVYSSDPKKFSDAKKYDKVSFGEVLEKNLKVMDSTAIALARDENLKIKVVKFLKKDSIKNAILSENEGTTIY